MPATIRRLHREFWAPCPGGRLTKTREKICEGFGWDLPRAPAATVRERHRCPRSSAAREMIPAANVR